MEYTDLEIAQALAASTPLVKKRRSTKGPLDHGHVAAVDRDSDC